jgi:exodeoxyribonuclease V alpha subunit
MLRGLAKAFFLDSFQRSPWISKEKENRIPLWPLLDDLLAEQRITYLDYILTLRLLRDYAPLKQEVALFICYLIKAVRDGHLCVQVENNQLLPGPEQIWSTESPEHLNSGYAQWKELLLEGAKHIPTALLTIIGEELDSFPVTPLCRYRNLFYLQRYWVFESIVLKQLKRHLQAPPSLSIDKEKVAGSVAVLLEKGVLLEEQAEAIMRGCLSAISLITGGPGTGKTYTAGYLIKVFWDNLSHEQRENCAIVLAAPTGKAAANLQRSLSKVSSQLEGFPSTTAKTLHSLLGIKSTNFSVQERASPLAADLILVDESSMIDVRLMARLLESVKEGARLILLGDQHQLPSVEAGSVFADFIHLYAEGNRKELACTKLQTCLRAELRSIIDFAALVNKGEADQALAILNENTHAGIHKLNMPLDKKEAQQLLIRHVQSRFPSVVGEQIEFYDLLHLFNSMRILSPLRKGPFGVDQLNELLWSHFSKEASDKGWLAVPIMVVANDYRQDLFNGEAGVLMRKLPFLSGDKSVQAEDFALFPSREGENLSVRKMPALLLPKYEYAYCLSVHKSQGSEFDQVLLVLPEGSEMFGREIFYTAVTRARKQLEIFGSDLIIHSTISQVGVRFSGISQRASEPSLS